LTLPTEKKVTLALLMREAMDIEAAILEASGEITEAIEEKLMEIDLSVKEKVDGTALVLERMEDSAEFWRAKAQGLLKVAEGFEKARERLKDYVKQVMRDAGVTELRGNEQKLALQGVKAKLEVDEMRLPAAYLKQETRVVADKVRIREALERGDEVEGARLIESYALRPKLNKERSLK